MRTRSAARAIALQALYQFDMRGEEFSGGLADFMAQWGREPATQEYARELIEGCRLAQSELDAAIKAKADNWGLSRMAAVDRTILRIGAYELIYGTDIPPKVAIDEAIRLAKKYSTEDSSAFVNGVLDQIMADVVGRTQGKA